MTARDGSVEPGTLFRLQIVAAVDGRQIDLSPFCSVVRLIELQPIL